jgi:hypothetical protein
MSAFGLPKSYYSFTFSSAHVTVMDTDRVSFSSGSAQYNFVKKDLESASAEVKTLIVSTNRNLLNFVVGLIVKWTRIKIQIK